MYISNWHQKMQIQNIGVSSSKAASVYFKEGNKSYQPAKPKWISQYGNKQAYKVLRNSHLKCRRIYNLLYVMFNVKKGNNIQPNSVWVRFLADKFLVLPQRDLNPH